MSFTSAQLQISALSFMASLEHMGAIEKGLPAFQAIDRMHETPQDLLAKMAVPEEAPLATLYRLHYEGFERHRQLIWWENTPKTEAFLKKVKADLRRTTVPSAEKIIRSYFSQVAKAIECGMSLFPMGVPWYDLFIRQSLGEIRGYNDPAERMANLAVLGVIVSLDGLAASSQAFFDEASKTLQQITKNKTRAADRLAVHWAKAGMTQKAREYFATRIEQAGTLSSPARAFTFRDILLRLWESGLTDLISALRPDDLASAEALLHEDGSKS